MNGVDELLRAAAELETLIRRKGWRFCFIGGVAVQRWGTPRFTQDIDLTLLTGIGDEEKFVDALLQYLNPCRADAREFALKNRVLLAQTREAVDVDIAPGCVADRRTLRCAREWMETP